MVTKASSLCFGFHLMDGLQLSAKCPNLWLHPELVKAHSYSDYVAWGCVACPAELFRDNVLNLFKAVVTDNLVFTLFRDEVR